MGSVVKERTARPVLNANDAREAIMSIAAEEKLPTPVKVSLTATGILVQVADRDEVDEWTEMLGAAAVRWGDLYGAGWQRRIWCPGTAVALTVFCPVRPIKWQPRTPAVSA